MLIFISSLVGRGRDVVRICQRFVFICDLVIVRDLDLNRYWQTYNIIGHVTVIFVFAAYQLF